MRSTWLLLGGLFLLACPLHAQQPQQAQQQQPVLGQPPQGGPPAATTALNPRDQLDSILMQWEAKMSQVQSLHARVVRETMDYSFRTKTSFEGEAKYLKPNLALLDMRQVGKPDRIEKYISTGTYLYEYNQPGKEIRLHELPPPKAGQVSDDNFLSFLFGMKAEEAKRRYDMRLMGQDANYYYLMVLPIAVQDKSEFQKAQIALSKSTFLPARLLFVEPNNNQVTWDLPVIQTSAQLDRREFSTPSLPEGWHFTKVAQPKGKPANAQPASTGSAPPRVVRPQQGP